jgi:thioredoxin-dependent peroxiredoxin
MYQGAEKATKGRQMAGMPKAGSLAPDFTLNDATGGTVSLRDLRGQLVVVYFYPKADTPGCTKEAMDFNRLKPDFDAAGTRIIGISADSVKAQEKFRARYDLAFPLASDPGREAIDAYGVWVEKSMYGRKYMGIERATFLIDADGRIARVWSKVKVPGHAEEVLAAARAL